MPDDGNLPKIIGDLGVAFEEYKRTNDAALLELKKRGATDVITADKLARIDDTLDKLSDIQAAIERAKTSVLEAAKNLNRPGSGSTVGARDFERECKEFNVSRAADATARGRRPDPEVDVEAYKAYREIFADLLRKGRDGSDFDRKTLAVGVDQDGGYVVPPDMSGRIITRLYETSPMRSIASIQPISTDALEGLRDTDEAGDGGWVGEQQPRPDTGTPNLGAWRIPVHEQYANPKATQKIIDDSVIDIEAWLAGKISDRLARREAVAFVTGDGVAKPRGFTNYATVATSDATRPWGAIEHVMTGVNGDFPASNPSDRLFDLIGAFKEGYLPNGRWVTKREVITRIRKFKDGQGQYLWIPGLLSGAVETLLGFPISKFEDLPALSTNGNSLWFGDFRQGYQIVDRQGLRVLRDPYTSKPFVSYYTTTRVGGDVVQFEAIKALRFSA
jgi:HK97 family phage major capsid protein